MHSSVQVVTDVLLQISIFRAVGQCRLVFSYQCFVGVCCYHLHGLRSPKSDFDIKCNKPTRCNSGSIVFINNNYLTSPNSAMK